MDVDFERAHWQGGLSTRKGRKKGSLVHKLTTQCQSTMTINFVIVFSL